MAAGSAAAAWAGYAAYAAMAVGTVYSVYSSQQSGKQAQLNADAQADQAQADAETEKSAAVVQAERIRKLARIQAGEANAALAGSGVEVGAGTALNINEEIYQNAEEDAVLTIMTGKNKGQRLDGDASNYRLTSKQIGSNNKAQTAASTLQAGSQLYSGWKAMAKASEPGGAG